MRLIEEWNEEKAHSKWNTQAIKKKLFWKAADWQHLMHKELTNKWPRTFFKDRTCSQSQEHMTTWFLFLSIWAGKKVACCVIRRRDRLVKVTSISRQQFASLRTKLPNWHCWKVNIEQVAFFSPKQLLVSVEQRHLCLRLWSTNKSLSHRHTEDAFFLSIICFSVEHKGFGLNIKSREENSFF